MGVAIARLPSVLASAGCVALTVSITRSLAGRANGMIAGMILALTYEFFRRTREISLDLWQLFFMLAALRLFIEGIRRDRATASWLAGIPLGFALMCKPLVAFLFIPVAAAWVAFDGKNCLLMHLAGLLAVACIVALPWHLGMYLIHGAGFTAQYFGREILARASGGINRQPFWYYAVEIGRTYWPWMLALVGGIASWQRPSARRRAVLRLAAFWAAVWVIALTAFPDKRPRYELPLYPALAVLAAHGLTRLHWRALRHWYRRGLGTSTVVAVTVGVIAALLPIRVQAEPDADLAALHAWMRTSDGRPIHSAAFSSNDEGYLYLITGQWPLPTRATDGALGRSFPRGTLFVYSDGLEPRPGSDEKIVFHHGRLTVTQLQGDRWRPKIER